MHEPKSGMPVARAAAQHVLELELAQHAHGRRERAHAGQQRARRRARSSSGSRVMTVRAPTRSSAFSTERRLPIP